MPRGFKNRTGAATENPATLDHNTADSPEQESPVTASTLANTTEYDEDEGQQFNISVEAAPADYTPDRKTPGRQRKTSVFDDVLRAEGVFAGGWQRVPVSSQEHKDYVIRELTRSKLFLNGSGKMEGEPEIGLDLDDKKDDAVYFKSRVAQKRERKNDNDALATNAEDEGYVDPDGDNDE